MAIVKCINEQIPICIYDKDQLDVVMEVMWLLYHGYYTILSKYIKEITDFIKDLVDNVTVKPGSNIQDELSI